MKMLKKGELFTVSKECIPTGYKNYYLKVGIVYKVDFITSGKYDGEHLAFILSPDLPTYNVAIRLNKRLKEVLIKKMIKVSDNYGINTK